MKNNVIMLSNTEITNVSGGNYIGQAGAFIGIGLFGKTVLPCFLNTKLVPSSTLGSLFAIAAVGCATQVASSWCFNLVWNAGKDVISKK